MRLVPFFRSNFAHLIKPSVSLALWSPALDSPQSVRVPSLARKPQQTLTAQFVAPRPTHSQSAAVRQAH